MKSEIATQYLDNSLAASQASSQVVKMGAIYHSSVITSLSGGCLK
jgi:hypothetical protein